MKSTEVPTQSTIRSLPNHIETTNPFEKTIKGDIQLPDHRICELESDIVKHVCFIFKF